MGGLSIVQGEAFTGRRDQGLLLKYSMVAARDRLWVGLFLVVLVLALSIPFIIANAQLGSDFVFSGFLFNPVDGNSYLAKMRQGWEGSWLFVLPYTAMPGEGAAINLYYLFLGHVARWLGLSLAVTFHLARLLGGVSLFLMIYRLSRRFFEGTASRAAAWLLASMGSGLGWMALMAGIFAPDFWMAEAFPFLSAYANPHFPLGMALQIWLLTPVRADEMLSNSYRVKVFVAALGLSLIYPFGLALSGLVLVGNGLYRIWKKLDKRALLGNFLLVAAGGGPFAIYQLWVVRKQPMLAQWNAQNQTPGPPFGMLLIALSPVIIFALLAAIRVIRDKKERYYSLLIWVISTFVAISIPGNLQRRFISAIFVPLAILAIEGIRQLAKKHIWQQRLFIAIILLSLPSNIIVILSGLSAVQSKDEAIYLHSSEIAAYEWLQARDNERPLVIAAPGSGLFLPVYSSARVLYGHPFESVEAELREDELNNFYAGKEDPMEMLANLEADYVFYGPREKEIGKLANLPGWGLVYDQSSVQIFAPIE